ncbi:uncharacterized protein LOC129232325 [Uloborus diversus]|uniref:uncharacterized protein LOC129221502 n=1 Tax=Uloborus diversus TaxID=327109 RepID=UPI00240A6605|nr:uncharacterized protein LOC129221502 [Uloborus diversus]XP_054722456.1 uncharacterized protein LOC129232325 [Uloborus diversus]
MATLVEGGDLLELIENYVKENKIMIFSKSSCPYCVKVKQLFQSLGVDYFALELDKEDNGSELQDAMAKKAGRRSVPQVFIKGTHIGGCDDTMAAHKSGKLVSLL